MSERFDYPLPFGAIPQGDGTTRFRIWAPSVPTVQLEIEGLDPMPMQAEGGGWFSQIAPVGGGAHYKYRLPEGLAVPDPASKFQVDGVHSASVVITASSYEWKHPDWRGRPWNEAVIYELHVGLLGGFEGVRQKLPELRDLGVTVIELMPVNEFPGAHNWGYDGTLPFSPEETYGTADELRHLIDDAHGLGLCVMLDVVYNHFGPDGAYLHAYAREFFTEDMHTPWGAAIDYRKSEVKEFWLHNALYWLNDFRFDGLRFDAMHAIMPQEHLHLLAHDIRANVSRDRHVHLVVEHEDNAASMIRSTAEEDDYDAQWADDFHHCMHVLMTGETGSYYTDYDDATRLLARCLSEGFAYQGEVSRMRGRRRGQPSKHLPPSAFVFHLQNHDQIGNRAHGERLHMLTTRDKLNAATALLLLAPMIPLIFMGDEWASKAPFLFFTDHHEELAELVRKGRAKEFGGFGVSSDPSIAGTIPDPNSVETFQASVPTRDDPEMFARYKALLELRRTRIVDGIPGARSLGCDVLADGAVAARWSLGDGATLTMLLNLRDDGVAAEMPPGEELHESQPGTAEAVKGGTLPPASLLAVLTKPAP